MSVKIISATAGEPNENGLLRVAVTIDREIPNRDGWLVIDGDSEGQRGFANNTSDNGETPEKTNVIGLQCFSEYLPALLGILSPGAQMRVWIRIVVEV